MVFSVLSFVESPPAKRRKIGRCAFHEEEPKKFAASLKVYDCNHQCLLSNGKYQVVLSDCKPVGSPSSKPMSWITLQEAKVGRCFCWEKCG